MQEDPTGPAASGTAATLEKGAQAQSQDLANRNIRFPAQFQFPLCAQSCLTLGDHMDRLLGPLDF